LQRITTLPIVVAEGLEGPAFPKKAAQSLSRLGKSIHDQGETGSSGFSLNILKVDIMRSKEILIIFYNR